VGIHSTFTHRHQQTLINIFRMPLICAVVVNQASLETVYSKKVTQYADVVGPRIGRYMGAFFMAASG
jgi:hypothetical protein